MVDLTKLTSRARAATQKWVDVYRIQFEIQATPAAKRAREIVLTEECRKKTRYRHSSPERMLSVNRALVWETYRLSKPGSSVATICNKAKVHRSDFYRWLSGAMPDESRTAKRIADELSRP